MLHFNWAFCVIVVLIVDMPLLMDPMVLTLLYVGGGADKSLARPGKQQATATKLGIYSTYSPRSSIDFLARCSNFCKPLKKIQKLVRPTRSPWQE